MNELAALSFIASFFYIFRLLFFACHCWVYATDGIGIVMFLTVCEFLNMICVNCWAAVGYSIVHGVYITRSEIPAIERQQFVSTISAFALCFLVSMLCSLQLDDFHCFGVSHDIGSLPYFLLRCMLAILTVRAIGSGVIKSVQSEEKRAYLTRFSIYFAGWLVSTPLLMISSHCWVCNSFRMEVCNILMVTLLHYSFAEERYGWLFSKPKATRHCHPYSEFGIV